MDILAEAAVRVTVLALGVALVLRALQIRSPRLAHGAWTAVIVVMLLLPAIVASEAHFTLPLLPSSTRSVLVATTAAGMSDSHSAPQRSGTTGPAGSAAHPADGRANWAVIVLGLYLAGVSLFLVQLAIGWQHARVIRREAVEKQGRLTHPWCVTPITIGLVAPAVILPTDWTDWDRAELAAVLAHEEEHARRRDPLLAAIALLNRAVFWFHPLAWWLQREIGRLSEQACDAVVISRGHDSDLYATCLLRFARRAAHAGGRVAPMGVAMPGAGLRTRLVMLARPGTTRPSRSRLACMALACAALVIVSTAAVPTAAPAQDVTGAAGQVGWRVDTSEHFEIVHQSLPADRVSDVIRDAEAAYARLSASLKHDMARRVLIVLVLRDRDLAGVVGQNSAVVPSSVAPATQRVVISLESLDQRPDLIVHELTHQFAFDIVPATSRIAPIVVEGLAEHQRGAWGADALRLIRVDASAGAIPSVANLDTTDRHWAHAVFDFVADRQGDEGIRRLLFALRARETLAPAVPMAFDVTLEQFDQAFRAYVTMRFGQP